MSLKILDDLQGVEFSQLLQGTDLPNMSNVQTDAPKVDGPGSDGPSTPTPFMS